MKLNRAPAIWIVILLTLVLAGCSAASEPQEGISTGGDVPPATAAVAAPGQGATRPVVLAPEEVVLIFYKGHIAAPGGLLRDHVYTRSPFLSAGVIQRLNRVLSDQENPISADPFLLAQTADVEITVELFAAAEDEARVIVHEHFVKSPQDLTVDLIREDGQWKINQIQKGSPLTPDGVVDLFYNGYLDITSRKNSPPAGSDYSASPYLTPAMIKRVEDTTRGYYPGMLDPFVLSEDIPDWTNTYLPELDGDRATVIVQFVWKDARKPSRLRKVFLVKSEAAWLIDMVSDDPAVHTNLPAPSLLDDNSVLFTSEEFGFSFRHPVGWDVMKAPSHPYPEEEADSPLSAQYLVAPTEVFEDIEARTDPETGYLIEGSSPGMSVPYRIDIFKGSYADVEDAYPYATLTAETQFNGISGQFRTLANGTIQHLFKQPARPGIWIVFTDLLTGDARFEAQARLYTGVLETLLDGIEFRQ